MRSKIRPARIGPAAPPLFHSLQATAQAWAEADWLVFACGRYEGIDARVSAHYSAREDWARVHEVSIGDYVLTNGALPAMVIIDSVTRLLPGVLGDDESSVDESFSDGLLEYPQYTRPAEYKGLRVPDVLVSGNHGAIAAWRQEQAEKRTRERRPDLLDDGN